jgi:hypothetical protein
MLTKILVISVLEQLEKSCRLEDEIVDDDGDEEKDVGYDHNEGMCGMLLSGRYGERI